MLRFVEGDFDAYIKHIRQPNAWGGETELLMATHVLKYDQFSSLSTLLINQPVLFRCICKLQIMKI